jgi:hypothetical protein
MDNSGSDGRLRSSLTCSERSEQPCRRECNVWHVSDLRSAERRNLPNEDTSTLMHRVNQAIETREVLRP